MQRLAQRLQVSAENIMAAYEDPFFYHWKELRLAVNVTPTDAKLGNSREQEELRKVYERGLGEPAGYVLPIRRRQQGTPDLLVKPAVVSAAEPAAADARGLAGGLPAALESLPWVAPDRIEYDYDQDPFADREKLPERPQHRPDLFAVTPPEDPQSAPPKTGESAEHVIRPSLIGGGSRRAATRVSAVYLEAAGLFGFSDSGGGYGGFAEQAGLD